MATRAERYRAASERSGPKKAPSPTRKAAQSKTDFSDGTPDPERRIEGARHTSLRNVSKRAGRKAEVVLEDSATGRPSRKSTRASKNRGRISADLERRAKRATHAPEARAKKAIAKSKKTR